MQWGSAQGTTFVDVCTQPFQDPGNVWKGRWRWSREALEYVPDDFKSKRMCERAVEDEPATLEFVPDRFKNQEMCKKAIEECSYMLKDMPDHFKTQKMRDAVVMKGSL